MNKKRKFSPLRFILLVLAIVACLVLAYLGIKFVVSKFNEPVTFTSEIDKDKIEVSENKDTTIEIIDYKVYLDDDEDLGFNFIVATLKFSTTKDHLYYDLGSLNNSERNIKLSEIDYYLEKLKNNTYDISKLDLANEIVSDSNTLTANILIPYINKNGVLNIYNGEKLAFDLNKNTVKASSLKPINHPDQEVVESNNYNITILNRPYLSTMMTHNGEEYDSSGPSIYTFEISINNVKEGVFIEDAIFIKDKSTDEIHALDSSFQSVKVSNIINMPLKANSKGALFFELYKNYDADINYDGVLRLKFSDSNKWEEINTSIR